MNAIKKVTKIILGVASVLMLVAIVVAFIIMRPNGRSDNFSLVILFFLGTISWIVLTIYYIIHVWKGNIFDKDDKITWTAVLIIFNILAFPFYWYFYIGVSLRRQIIT